jgi:hypothetical protein
MPLIAWPAKERIPATFEAAAIVSMADFHLMLREHDIK